MASRLAAQIFGVILAFLFGRNGKEELADCAVLRLKTGGEFNEFSDGNDIYIEPPECTGIVIVALGEDGLKPGQKLKFLEVDLVDLVERSANRLINVKVAARKYRSGVEELLKNRERQSV